jgi:hypothetical protein
VHVHPQFNPSTFDNDVALVQLKQHLTFNDYVQPICVDESHTLEREFFAALDSSNNPLQSLAASVRPVKHGTFVCFERLF